MAGARSAASRPAPAGRRPPSADRAEQALGPGRARGPVWPPGMGPGPARRPSSAGASGPARSRAPPVARIPAVRPEPATRPPRAPAPRIRLAASRSCPRAAERAPPTAARWNAAPGASIAGARPAPDPRRRPRARGPRTAARWTAARSGGASTPHGSVRWALPSGPRPPPGRQAGSRTEAALRTGGRSARRPCSPGCTERTASSREPPGARGRITLALCHAL
jgi:hypothetical protein